LILSGVFERQVASELRTRSVDPSSPMNQLM
jgi:hypothetical protein